MRVRFLPEKHQNSNNQITTRTLVSDNIFWEEWDGKTSGAGGVEDPTNPDGNTEENPLG